MVQERNGMRDVGGVGIGFRPQLATALLGAPERVDFVEVVAEACRDVRARREAAAVAELWPVVPHGVKLSLGSADGIEPERAKELGELARELRAPMVSEHVSFVRAGGREIGHLTELPMTREAIRVVRPWAVDVSSGVEQSRGIKDHNKMAAFVRGVRNADV